jgi:hypothetical protein
MLLIEATRALALVFTEKQPHKMMIQFAIDSIPTTFDNNLQRLQNYNTLTM